MNDEIQITDLIKSINQAVAEGDLSKLDPHFHENVKIISHDLKVLGDGKAVCIQSYADFISKAKIKKYDDNVKDVFLYENTAIVFYNNTMTWEIDGKSFTEQGEELYVLTRENDKWLIVLRKLIASSSQ